MIQKTPLPSAPQLCARFVYDPQSGVVHHRAKTAAGNATARERSYIERWNVRFANKQVGGGKKSTTVINKQRYLLHRIIWKMVTGDEPDCVDHLNGDQADNRWANLRSVSQGENNLNCRARSDNTSGVAGVHFDKRRNRWSAEIRRGGHRHYLGRFDSMDDAVIVRRAAQAEMGFTERHGL